MNDSRTPDFEDPHDSVGASPEAANDDAAQLSAVFEPAAAQETASIEDALTDIEQLLNSSGHEHSVAHELLTDISGVETEFEIPAGDVLQEEPVDIVAESDESSQEDHEAAPATARSNAQSYAQNRALAYRASHNPLMTAVIWGGSMLAGFILLVGAGLMYINQLDSNIGNYMAVGSKYPTAQKPEYVVEKAAAVYDEQFRVSVLNGTTVDGLSASASSRLFEQGYNTSGTANASEQIETSGVYYNNINAEGSARAVAQELGIETVELATAYQGVPITVLLGDDYANAQP